MSAYMIVNVDVRDSAAYEENKARVPALIQKHGGEYLVRGGKFVVAEDIPYISLWFNDNICVHRARITNIQLSPTGDFDFLTAIEAN